jgi:hypothetical protein
MAAISHLTFRFALGQERSPVGDAQAGARMSTIVTRLSAQDSSAAAAYYQQVPGAGAPASPPASR